MIYCMRFANPADPMSDWWLGGSVDSWISEFGTMCLRGYVGTWVRGYGTHPMLAWLTVCIFFIIHES